LAKAGALGLVVVLSLLATTACEDKHIGRVCELNIPDAGASATNATINPQALECPSRTCILPNAEKSVDMSQTGPLCTASCNTDDYCSDAEGGPKGDKVDRRCESGFACVIPTTVGDFRCRWMCVCRDFLAIDQNIGYRKPPSCN
jgi:hypothetical protein